MALPSALLLALLSSCRLNAMALWLQQLYLESRPERINCFECAQVPGIYKIRYIGQTTLSSAAVRSAGLH